MSRPSLGRIRGLHDALGLVAVIGGSFGVALAQWCMFLFIARAGSGDPASSVGQYALLLAISTPIFTLFQFGLRNLFVSNSEPASWRSYCWLRVAGSVAAAAAFVTLAWLMKESALPLILAVTLVKVGDGAMDLLLAPLQRDGDLIAMGALRLLNALGTIVLAGVVVALGYSPVWCVFSSGVISVAAAVVTWWRSRRNLQSYRASAYEPWAALIRPGLWIAAGQVFGALVAYVPLALLYFWSDVDTVGVYSVAAYIVMAGALLGTALQATLLPRFRSESELNGDRRARRDAVTLTIVAGAIGCLGSIFIVVIANDALPILYGKEFAVGWASWVLLGLAGVTTMVSGIFSAYVLVLNRYGVEAKTMIASAGVAALTGAVMLQAGIEPLLAVSFGTLCGALVRMAGLTIGGLDE